jgi:hypothetical protein
VEIRPSTRSQEDAEARAVVLVFCQEFAGSGPWMSQEQERDFMENMEANGRQAARLGPEVEEPWRI